MITGLIFVARPADPDAIDRLADTLAGLVAGVAAGLVGDAVIVATGPSKALETIAEGSGATLIVSAEPAMAWSAGARVARRDWVLCLEAGDVLREGWIRALDRFVGTARSQTGLGRFHHAHAGLSARIAARFERTFGAPAPRAGDVVRRSLLLGGPRFPARLSPRMLPAQLDRS